MVQPTAVSADFNQTNYVLQTKVATKQLGYSACHLNKTIGTYSLFSYSNLECLGSELYLSDCLFDPVTKCPNGYAVFLAC